MPQNTQPILKEIIKFIQNPKNILHDKPDLKETFFTKLKTVITIVSCVLVLAAILGYLSSLFASSLGFSPQDNYLVVNELVKMSVWKSFVFLVILGPFYEELSFRLFLNPKKLSIIVGLFFFFTFLLQVLLSLQILFVPDSYIFSLILSSPLFYLILLIVLSISFLIIYFVIPATSIEIFFKDNLKLLVYSSAILFAAMHIQNYTNVGSLWWTTPLLVLPQLLVGFVLPFVRLRFGFWWSMFAHGLYNFILGFTLMGFLAGPESVRNWVIQYNMNPEKMSKFSSFEIGYVNAVSFAGAVIYGTVLFLFLEVMWEYIRVRRFDKTQVNPIPLY